MATAVNQLVVARDAGKRRPIRLANAAHIYQGTLVFAAADGFATETEGGGPFLGVAVGEYDNSSGVDGDVNGEVYTEGSFELPFSAGDASQAIVGDAAYAVDNFDVDDASTNNTRIGNFSRFISASKVEVEIEVCQ